MSRLAADPALKRALAEMGQQVSVLKGDVRKLDEKKLASLQTTLDDACHK
jgi:ABC-type methionine transport system ATPase subunit